MKGMALALAGFAIGFAIGRDEFNAFMGVVSAALAGALCMIGLMMGYVVLALRGPGEPGSPASRPSQVVRITGGAAAS